MGSSIGASIVSGQADPSAPAYPVAVTGLNTTGAGSTGGFLHVMACGYQGGLVSTSPTDTYANIWNLVVGPNSPDSADASVVTWACFGGTVGAGHDFQIGLGCYAHLMVDARAGVFGASGPYCSGSNYQGDNGGNATLNWSLTPPDNGSILYLVASITDNGNPSGGGFSAWDLTSVSGGVSGVAYPGEFQAIIQGAATNSAPSITPVGSGVQGGYLISFKPASYTGGGGGTQNVTFSLGAIQFNGRPANANAKSLLTVTRANLVYVAGTIRSNAKTMAAVAKASLTVLGRTLASINATTTTITKATLTFAGRTLAANGKTLANVVKAPLTFAGRTLTVMGTVSLAIPQAVLRFTAQPLTFVGNAAASVLKLMGVGN